MSRKSRHSAHLSTRLDSAPDSGGSTEPPSKSARKRQAQALQDLGLALARLPEQHRQAVDMPDDLREAIETYLKTRSHEGRRRQLQFVGKLLRRADPAPLLAAVEGFQSGRAADAERLHTVERWRDALIADDEALTRWAEAHPDSDLQQLRNLIRAARKEGAGGDPEQRQPRSFRQLFRLIRAALDDNGAA